MPADNQRQADARRRQELADANARAEAQAAQVQLDAFVGRLNEAGAAPEQLQALLHNGSRVKSDRTGWYLNNAHTVAVTPDGTYLQLVTAGGPLARFTGVRVPPAQPTLVIGRGARDGESGDLGDFLDRALEHYLPG